MSKEKDFTDQQLNDIITRGDAPQIPSQDDLQAQDFLTFYGLEIPESNRATPTVLRDFLAKKPLNDAKKMLDCPTPRFWALQAVKIGVMSKQGFHHKRWQRRLFALEGHYLYYYDQESDAIPKGVILLEGAIVEEDCTQFRGKDHRYCFSITAKKSWRVPSCECFETRTYWFTVGSVQELNDWVALINLLSYNNTRYACEELW